MARTYRSDNKYAPSFFASRTTVIDLEVEEVPVKVRKQSKVAKRFKKVAQYQ
ncbi:MAG: hypothetical protein RBJ76_13385 [Stenomitos frigidus ULC029]